MKSIKLSEINIKKASYILCAGALIGWVIFRFAAIGAENARYVFNPTRVAMEQGTPVEVVVVENSEHVLKEPIGIKNNKAFVSNNRVARFAAGQKVDSGKIVSVSSGVDLDTGMHVIRTRGVSDGLHYAEFVGNGYLVPAYAVVDGKVFVVSDGAAVAREVKVARQDSENALITEGLTDGDRVILSKVNNGEKVRTK